MIASSQMQGGMTDPAKRVVLLLEKMNVIKQIVLHDQVIIQVEIDVGFPLRVEKRNDLITFSEIREDELEGIITIGSVTFSIHASGLLTLIGTISVESGEVVEGNDPDYALNFCRDLLDSGYEQGKITWIKPEGMFEPVQFTRNTSVEIVYTVDPGKVYGSHYQETICIEPLLPSMLTSEKIFTTEEGHVTDKVWLLKREFLPEALDQSIRSTKQVELYRSTEALWKACKGERTPLFFMFALKSSYLKSRQQDGKNVLVCLAGKRLVPINADVTAWMLRNIPDMELVCYGNNNFAAIESAGQIVGFLQFMNIQGLENIEFIKAEEKPAKEPVATVETYEAPALLETEGLETQEPVVLSDAEKALALRTWTLKELIGILDDNLLDGKKLSKKEASELVRNIAKAKAAFLGKKNNWDMDKAVFKNLVRWILDDQVKQQGPAVQSVLTQEPYMVPFESFVVADTECFKAGEALRKAEDELLYVARFIKTGKSALKNTQTEQKRALQRVSMERHSAKMRHRKLIEEAIQQYEGLEIPLEVLSPYVEDSEIIKAYLVRKESANGSMAGPQEIEEITLIGNLEAPEQVISEMPTVEGHEEEPVLNIESTADAKATTQEQTEPVAASEPDVMPIALPVIQFSLETTLHDVSLVHDQVTVEIEALKEACTPKIEQLKGRLTPDNEKTAFGQAISQEIQNLETRISEFCDAVSAEMRKTVNDLYALVTGEVCHIIQTNKLKASEDFVTEKSVVDTSMKAVFKPFEREILVAQGVNISSSSSVTEIIAAVMEHQKKEIQIKSVIFSKLKPLGVEAQAIFEALVDGLSLADGEKSSRRIGEPGGAYMPVSVERLWKDKYSVTHYYEMNGDLMRDPDMEFVRHGDRIYPVYFRQDGYPGAENEVFTYDDRGKIVSVDDKVQKGLATFANTWMKNIKRQHPEYFTTKKPTPENDPHSQQEVLAQPEAHESTGSTPDQAQRFQVGNRVQIDQAIGLPHLAGQTGTITAVDTTSGIAYLVKLDTGQLIDPFDESHYDPIVHDEFLVLLGEDSLSVETPQLDAVASAPVATPTEPKALKIGDRVEIIAGLFQGRHGTITEFGKPLAMIGENSRTVNTCQIRTDNGAVVNQTEATLVHETRPPVNVLPDIQVDQEFFTHEAIYMVLLTIEKRVLDYKAKAAAEKDPSKKAECDNLIKTASLKGKELADLFRKWGAQYPEQAKEIISKCKEEYAARKAAEEHKLQKPESKPQQQTPPARKKASTYYDPHFKRRGWSSVGGMTRYEQKMMR